MQLNKVWSLFLQTYLQSNEYDKLNNYIEDEYKRKTIFPKYENIFRAFNLVTPSEVKVVIIGQDPYHGLNQANGLAFSVCDTCKIPPSLVNIFKEYVEDTGYTYPSSGDLTKWSEEGVLLMNTVLTVQEAKANSHKNIGWEDFTDNVIKKLSSEYKNIVFILWGNPSQNKSTLIDESKHLVLKAPHPSPLSSYRGFLGSKPFSITNEYLKNSNKEIVNWRLN